MKKRKTIYLMILLIFIAGTANANLFSLDSNATSGEKEKKTIDIDFSLGLNSSFNTTQVKVGSKKTANSLVYSYVVLEVDADMDFLTLGLLAGFNNHYFKNPVDFEELPLSLRFNKAKSNSIVLGLTATSEFSLFDDFTLMPHGEFLYFSPLKRESVITLPIVSGTAISRISFYQASIELLGQYDGFSTVTVFFGPQLLLAGGNYKASETIEDITGNETMNFKQKNILGIVGGVKFDLGEHFCIDLKATLISKTAFSARIMYVF